jgi:hypothetical protein
MIRLFACVMLLGGPAFAGLEWKQNEVRLTAHPAQVTAEARFAFVNAGDEPVAIPDIVLNCGCLAAKPLKPSYAPGEEGSLIIMIDLRSRDGVLHKQVLARTDDGREQALSIVVDIPIAYEMGSRFVYWGEGAGLEDKTARLTNPNVMPVKLLSITSSHASLPAELKTIREGFEYEVVVHRASDQSGIRSVIRIDAEPPPGAAEGKIIKLYAYTL